MDGVVEQLLQLKWQTFVRRRFYRNFVIFFIHFLLLLIAFWLRPATDRHPNVTEVVNPTTGKWENVTTLNACYLMDLHSMEDAFRMLCECCVLLSAIINLLLAGREVCNQGFEIFWKTLTTAPMKLLHLLSCLLVILMLPGRALCAPSYEDSVGIIAVLATAPYFLFFCRGFKIVGPFVVMIYNMVTGDLLRFVIIYLIFLTGFSQAMFIIFRRVPQSMFNEVTESFMGLFIMSLGEFSGTYEKFDCSDHRVLGRILFLLYMILVTLLLVNMLIAMMGNTYNMINETQKEWLRQWAKIILVIEQTFSVSERRDHLLVYSLPMQDGRRSIVINTRNEEIDSD